MQTLIIVSHPTLADSNAQRFLWESLPAEGVTWHHLESVYPDGQIDREAEQQQLLQYDRIIFQFPFYWYSSPALLKQWQDVVLTEGFAYGADGSRLSGKEFGLVLALGVNEREYQAGGREGFTISELTRPLPGDGKEMRHGVLADDRRFEIRLSERQQEERIADRLSAIPDQRQRCQSQVFRKLVQTPTAVARESGTFRSGSATGGASACRFEGQPRALE